MKASRSALTCAFSLRSPSEASISDPRSPRTSSWRRSGPTRMLRHRPRQWRRFRCRSHRVPNRAAAPTDIATPSSARARLEHALHGTFMRLVRNVPTGVRHDIDLEALLQRGERRADDARTGPKACQYNATLSDPIDLRDDVLVLPSLFRIPVDEFLICEDFGDFVKCLRAGKRFFRDGGDDGRNLELGGRP